MVIVPHRRKHFGGSSVSTTNLVSFWKLTESSGTRYDSFGSNDLTDNNTVGQGTGNVYANCADLESTNTEYLEISDASQTGLDVTGDFSFTAWVNLESEGTLNTVLSKWADTALNNESYALYYFTTPDTFQWAVHDGTGSTAVNASSAITTSTWYFVYCYHDATANEIGISINNGTVATAAHSTGVADSTRSFIIGAFDDASGRWPFDGLIESVSCFSAVLSSEEVTALADKDDPFYDQF